MDGKSILSYLNQLCRDMDAGRQLRRFRWRRAVAPLLVPAALGLAGGVAGCSREDCGDGQDNDGDGRVDCADDDCYGRGSCPDPDRIAPPDVSEYAAPRPDPIPAPTPPPVVEPPPPVEDEATLPRPLYADDPSPQPPALRPDVEDEASRPRPLYARPHVSPPTKVDEEEAGRVRPLYAADPRPVGFPEKGVEGRPAPEQAIGSPSGEPGS